MSDFVIWLGEEIQEKCPGLTWEQIMELVAIVPLEDFKKCFGIDINKYKRLAHHFKEN